MLEGRRQAYLSALGIKLYVARAPLPHAAPSWFPEWVDEAQQDVVPEDEPTASPSPGSGHTPPPTAGVMSVAVMSDEQAYFAGDFPAGPPPGPTTYVPTGGRDPVSAAHLANAARNALGGKANGKLASPRETNAEQPRVVPPLFDDPSRPIPTLRNLKDPLVPADAARANKAPDELRIALATFEWTGYLRVLIEMQDPDAPSLSAREHRLWGEIALALWGREKAYQSQALPLFRFPPNRQLKHLQAPQPMREAVEGFLQARQTRSPVVTTVLFAGPGLAAAYTGELGAVLSQPLPVLPPDAGSTLLLLPSLQQLLGDWRLKPVVWSALSAVFRAVEGSK